MNTNIIVIAGPTGVGESVITKKIINFFPRFTRLITATSRKPRLNEKHKQDYYFFSKEGFLKEIEKGNIPEYTYIKNRDVYYGSYLPDLEKKIKENFIIIANTDAVGTRYYKKNYNALTIFIKPDSIENLKKRLRKRDKNISEKELKKRIENAKKEIQNEEKYYDYVVINKEGYLKEAVKEVKNIIEKEIKL